MTNGSPPNWQLLHLDPATSPENGTPESNSCLECNRALEQLPEFEDGCRKRGMLRQAPTKGGNCSCACVACEVMAPRCDPSSSCVLGAPIRVPHNKWTCCRPCLGKRNTCVSMFSLLMQIFTLFVHCLWLALPSEERKQSISMLTSSLVFCGWEGAGSLQYVHVQSCTYTLLEVACAMLMYSSSVFG